MGRGWEKVDNPHILGRKYVDKSLLQQGTTIPLYLVESFLENISNNKIPLGTQVNVKIIIENVKYDNNIRNVNRSKVNSDTIQLMFRKKSGILECCDEYGTVIDSLIVKKGCEYVINKKVDLLTIY